MCGCKITNQYPSNKWVCKDSHLCVGVFSRWAVAEIMEVVVVNQTVLSLSAPLHTRGLFIQGMCVFASAWHALAYVCVRVRAHVEQLGGLCFFLYRWFCPLVCVSGSVSFPCWDGLVMHREVASGQIGPLSAVVSLSLSSMLWSLSFSLFLFSPFLWHNLLCMDPFISFTFVYPVLSISPSFFQSAHSLPLSFSLSPCHFIHHKHFQCWHTRVGSHTESSATTIMSTLSSHNNTRITCWERQALLGAVSPTWLRRIVCQHLTELRLWKCEIWSWISPLYAVFSVVSACVLFFFLCFCFPGWDVVVRWSEDAHLL